MPESTRSKLSQQAVCLHSLKHQVKDIHNFVEKKGPEQNPLVHRTPVKD
jgi:hypothetical protein